MTAWLAPFDGIPISAAAAAQPPETMFTIPDLADVLAKRAAVRAGNGNVVVSVASLRAIAERLEQQSQRILALEGGIGALIDAEAVEAYQAQQEAAERAAVKVGVLVVDPAEDSAWSGLYDHAGRLVEQGHGSNIVSRITDEGWSVTKVDAEGLLFDWNGDSDPSDDDLTEFPDNLGALNAALARMVREDG